MSADATPPAPPTLDAPAVRAIVATRGVELAEADAAELLGAVRHARAVLAAQVAELCADDDIHAFRAILAREASR
ncbi:MAG: hypothetical protein J2P20_11375 [Pseudonocardia sp.]|nr:hypothetical protein [Pseudonocardia sp.]